MVKYVRQNPLRGTGRATIKRTTRKRRVNVAKVRYQAPTARNQKTQILANARTLARHSRILRTNKIYTDYQQDGTMINTTSDSWSVQRLTDFSAWSSVMRQSEVVATKAHTFVLRLSINMRFVLNDQDFLGVSAFIVTKRKNANQFDPFSTPPSLNTEYIENSQAQGLNIRLNPAVYKVHWAKYMTLTSNGMHMAAITGDPAGNPNTTWRKCQVNLPVRMSVTQPILYGSVAGAWSNLHFENLPPYHQYFLMCYVSFAGTGTTGHSIVYDQLATCVNAA